MKRHFEWEWEIGCMYVWFKLNTTRHDTTRHKKTIQEHEVNYIIIVYCII